MLNSGSPRLSDGDFYVTSGPSTRHTTYHARHVNAQPRHYQIVNDPRQYHLQGEPNHQQTSSRQKEYRVDHHYGDRGSDSSFSDGRSVTVINTGMDSDDIILNSPDYQYGSEGGTSRFDFENSPMYHTIASEVRRKKSPKHINIESDFHSGGMPNFRFTPTTSDVIYRKTYDENGGINYGHRNQPEAVRENVQPDSAGVFRTTISTSGDADRTQAFDHIDATYTPRAHTMPRSSSAHHRSKGSSHGSATVEGGRKFLRSVQDELDEQRSFWQPEVNEMIERNGEPGPKGPDYQAGRSGYVDTSSGHPIFRAHFDIRPHSAKDATVDIEYGRIVVRAGHTTNQGRGNTLTKTFTQKVTLPRFADEQRMRWGVDKNGELTVEIPLLFYFPQHAQSKQKTNVVKVKSSTPQILTKRNGIRVIQITLDIGGIGVDLDDVQVHIVDDKKLVISAGKEQSNASTFKKSFTKRYVLPQNADVDNVTSSLNDAGKLVVQIPILDIVSNVTVH